MAVTTDTIATALGVAVPSPTSPQAAQWQMWISDALMLIDARKQMLYEDLTPAISAAVIYSHHQMALGGAAWPYLTFMTS